MPSNPEQPIQLSPTKLALRKIRDLKQQVARLESDRNEDIAIVSMACRFPRHSNTPEAYWDSLISGADEVGDVPADRWDIEAYFDEDMEKPGRMYTRRGAFLSDIDQMDADFFGISPREATWIDPQQRVLLEVSWEALERACWPPDVVGHETGVFIGWMHNDYQNEASDSLLNLNPYIATGSAGSFLCGRLSYQLGLQGPSLAVDTACSSSLVALHLAIQSLSRRECNRALVGGVNIMASPKTTVLTCKLKALSPGGNSRAFDARADGYVRGEGCGVVALRRLSDAERDGDNVLAVIRGSAITHNGTSSGLTAPNAEAQGRAIKTAIQKAAIDPSTVDYLEAHGTGTELGDPIEMRAAANVLAEGRDPKHPLLVGSVKTNIGHLEAAAGMAGLIKVVLSLQHGCIPPHVHFKQPNPHIAWDQLPVKVVCEPTQWPHDGKRVAGVSAFGMSGTNAHVVLEGRTLPSPRTSPFSRAAKEDLPAVTGAAGPSTAAGSHSHGMNADSEDGSKPSHLLVLSGKTDEAVQELAARYRCWFEKHSDADLASVCHTAGTGRKHFERRAALIINSTEQAQSLLSQLEQYAPAPGLFRGVARSKPQVAWQFTGQGSQYVGMGEQLYTSQPVFRDVLDRCDRQLRQWREGSLLDVMFRDETLLNQTVWTQPALFVLEVGCAELLKSWGFEPDLVLGHSVGQFAAACVAGMIGCEDGLKLIAERSRLCGSLPEGGAMGAVFAPPSDVQNVVNAHADLSVAAFNGAHVVISGTEGAVRAALTSFSDRNVRCRRLTTSHAFHSSLLDPILDAWQIIADATPFRRANVPLVCNLTGKLLDADCMLDGEYWRRHLREPVQFTDSIQAVAEFGCEVVLEIGPQPILTGMAASCWPSAQPELITSLRVNEENNASILNTLADLYVQGVTPDFAALAGSNENMRIELPTYPFQRKRYWGPAKPQAAQVDRDTIHPLLGAPLPLAGVSNEKRFENELAPSVPRWLEDHKVFGDLVFPGAGYVEMALAAIGGQGTLQDAAFELPLRMSQSAGTPVQTVVRSTPNQPASIEIYSTSKKDVPWTRHFSATGTTDRLEGLPAAKLADLVNRCKDELDTAEFYDAVNQLGLQYGPQFQTITELHCGEVEVLARLTLDRDVRGYVIPPMLLDGAFQSLASGLLKDPESSFFLPVGVERLECFGSNSNELWCHAQWCESEGELRTADLTLFEEHGTVVARIEKLQLRAVSRAALRQLSGSGPERLVYSLQWQPTTMSPPNPEADRWIIVRETGSTKQEALLAAISEQGQKCIDVLLADDVGEPEFTDQSCTISGKLLDHWNAVLDRYFPAEQELLCDGVVWLAGSCDDSSATRELSTRTELVCSGVLGLLHALRRRRVERLERGLQILTRGAIATTDGDSASPDVSQFWGLGRVLSAEYPGLRCRMIDIEDPDESWSDIIDILLTDSRENQITLRSGQLLVPRLAPTRAPSGEFSIDTEGSSYLITGGLGKLGCQAARWLARRGAKDIVLVSRKEPSESTREIIDEIENRGCRVHIRQADVSQPSDMAELFGWIRKLPPLKGVIHAAGMLDDGLLAEQTWSRFETVLASKQNGARLLHEFTADMPLDFFILYSSAASVLGSPGQANYATANAYLDGLAHLRTAAGLPALSVNWGPWDEGMAASPTVVKSLALTGITPLTADESHQVLEQLMISGAVQATVLDVDWQRMRKRLAAYALPILDLVTPQVGQASSGDSELVEKLRAIPEAERQDMLATHVAGQLQQVLSLPVAPDAKTPLAELGLDSLMAVELSTRLQQQFEPEIVISPTIAFDHPSIGALTDHLLSLLKALPKTIESVSFKTVVSQDDVAIIGLSCRFPGAANAEEFWQNLRDGIDSVGELPPDRWDIDKYYSPTPAPGKMYTREGGFLNSIGDFDAEFFGITPQEACWIDPQHRLLMEVSWEALEDAGIPPRKSDEPRVGVFMGIMSQDYAQLHVDDDIEIIDGFQGAGLSHSAGVGRLSYMFGFEGPCMAIDSASSSSLVAVCQAAKSLLQNECNLALAGGVNAILTPTTSLLLCKAGMLAPDGRCKSFSAAANGFGRGEGCGVVILKRLSDAERDGDRVLAVIRGSAISHNGFSGGLTVPSGRSQERMIREALQQARFRPTDVDYLEAHGTGTELGDPIEMNAAATVLGEGRSADNPLLAGSVKANIGHLEAAGGISGLIKVVLSMQHAQLPRQLHFDEPSPHIAWDRIPVKVVTEPTLWPRERSRTASVSALGMSGTNAHVVLEAVAREHPVAEETPERSHHLLVFSGKSTDSLHQTAGRYRKWLEASTSANLPDACYTAATGRQHWGNRAALVLSSAQEALGMLSAIECDEAVPNVFQGKMSKSAPKLAWMFSGEGAEYIGMGEALYVSQPKFRQVVDRFDNQLWQDRDGSLTEAMFRDEALLAQPIWRLPALFTLQAALTELWKNWGVEPDVVFGRGVGQYAAACAAGVMTWEDGLRLVTERSRVSDAIFSELAIPSAVVGVDEVGAVPEAAVSPAALDEFEAIADTIDYFPADRPLICSLTGKVVPVHRVLGGSYWKRQMTEAASMTESFHTLSQQDCQLVVEIGPQCELSNLAATSWPGAPPEFLSSLRDGVSDMASMLKALGQLYISGINPDFAAFDEPWPRRKSKLPTYPFQRKRYWITDVSKHTRNI